MKALFLLLKLNQLSKSLFPHTSQTSPKSVNHLSTSFASTEYRTKRLKRNMLIPRAYQNSRTKHTM